MAFSPVTFVNVFTRSSQPITSLAISRSFPLVSSRLSSVYLAKNPMSARATIGAWPSPSGAANTNVPSGACTGANSSYKMVIRQVSVLEQMLLYRRRKAHIEHIHVRARRYDGPGHIILADNGWLGLQPVSYSSLSIVVLDPILLVIVRNLHHHPPQIQCTCQTYPRFVVGRAYLSDILETAPHEMLHPNLLSYLVNPHRRPHLLHLSHCKRVDIDPSAIDTRQRRLQGLQIVRVTCRPTVR